MLLPNTAEVYLTFTDLKTGNAEVDAILIQSLNPEDGKRSESDIDLINTAIITFLSADPELRAKEVVSFETKQDDTMLATVILLDSLDEDLPPIA